MNKFNEVFKDDRGLAMKIKFMVLSIYGYDLKWCDLTCVKCLFVHLLPTYFVLFFCMV